MSEAGRFSIDLLLSHGYVLADDPHEREIMMPYPSLGILYLSSYLKERGFGVEIHDSTFSTLAGFRQHLESCRPRVVGLSCNLLTRGNILRMVGWSREAGATVVLGQCGVGEFDAVRVVQPRGQVGERARAVLQGAHVGPRATLVV